MSSNGESLPQSLSHLAPSTRRQAALDDVERIRITQGDRWIDYPRALRAREHLERLLTTPKRERMPCMIVHGDSNIGKTLILHKFQREHPPAFDYEAGIERRPVISVQMPATP